jgi:hypothetical protein
MKRPTEKNVDLIPPGPYCYMFVDISDKGVAKTLRCPYWEKRLDKPIQENGYCHYLERGDWEDGEGIPLLWDGCKECGLNDSHDPRAEKDYGAIIAWAERALEYNCEGDEDYRQKILDWIERLRETHS